MPFTKDTAAEYGRMGGSRSKDPTVVRNRILRLSLSQPEYDMIKSKAAADKISRTELIVRAVRDCKT